MFLSTNVFVRTINNNQVKEMEEKPFENKFSSYRTVNDIKEEKQDVISLKLNPKERMALEKDKAVLQQEKDGTAIKQMVEIARKVIHGTPEGLFFQTALENMRRNKRLGIVEVEPNLSQK